MEAFMHPIKINNSVRKGDKIGLEIIAQKSIYKKGLLSGGKHVKDLEVIIFFDGVSTIENVIELTDAEPTGNVVERKEGESYDEPEGNLRAFVGEKCLYWIRGKGSDNQDYWALVESNELDYREQKQVLENLVKAGRYEEAAVRYERLGMFEKAGELRRRGKERTVVRIDVNALVKQLVDRGQTLTYYCCRCGAPLKIGAESAKAPTTCPYCGHSLEVVDLAKFISRHLS